MILLSMLYGELRISFLEILIVSGVGQVKLAENSQSSGNKTLVLIKPLVVLKCQRYDSEGVC